MSFQTISLHRDGPVTRLRLDRADKRNALSERMLDELTEAARGLAADDSRVIVLEAAGDVFCAGGDLGWMRAQMEATPEARRDGARRLSDMLAALDTLPKPLIGCVEGNAFGGGLGLMSVCDSVICAEGARFGLTETRLGLVPATIGPYVLARIGAHARRYFFTPRLFDAVEARHIGLVSRVVAAGDIEAALADEIAPCLAAAPAAVARGKALRARLGHGVTEAQVEAALDALVESWEHPEAQEGIAAFFDKRPPDWAG